VPGRVPRREAARPLATLKTLRGLSLRSRRCAASRYAQDAARPLATLKTLRGLRLSNHHAGMIPQIMVSVKCRVLKKSSVATFCYNRRGNDNDHHNILYLR